MNLLLNLIKPFAIYGVGALLVWFTYIAVYGFDENVSLGLLWPLLVIPTFISSIIHQRLSKLGYLGGALSGLLISFISICFLSGWYYLYTILWDPYLFFTPLGMALIPLFYGSFVGLPVGIGLGCIYYHLFVRNRSTL